MTSCGGRGGGPILTTTCALALAEASKTPNTAPTKSLFMTIVLQFPHRMNPEHDRKSRYNPIWKWDPVTNKFEKANGPLKRCGYYFSSARPTISRLLRRDAAQDKQQLP